MVAQITATIQTSIIHTYTDFDGVTVDVVEMVYPNGKTETRSCWTEEDFTTGETIHHVITRSGTDLRSTWETTQNNKWMQTYIALWMQRYQAERDTYEANMDTLTHPEFYTPDEYARAKADLGFDW